MRSCQAPHFWKFGWRLRLSAAGVHTMGEGFFGKSSNLEKWKYCTCEGVYFLIELSSEVAIFLKKQIFLTIWKNAKGKRFRKTASCVNQNMIPRTRRESKNVATFRRNINNTNTNNANVINLKVEVLSWKLLLTVSIQNQW